MLDSAVPVHKASAVTSAYVLLVLLVEFQIRVEIHAHTAVDVLVIKIDLLLNLYFLLHHLVAESHLACIL